MELTHDSIQVPGNSSPEDILLGYLEDNPKLFKIKPGEGDDEDEVALSSEVNFEPTSFAVINVPNGVYKVPYSTDSVWMDVGEDDDEGFQSRFRFWGEVTVEVSNNNARIIEVDFPDWESD